MVWDTVSGMVWNGMGHMSGMETSVNERDTDSYHLYQTGTEDVEWTQPRSHSHHLYLITWSRIRIL